MKTLLFHVNSFLTGGIEKILLEILKGLNPDKYNILLSIAYNMEEKELLRDQIPPYVEVHYLLDHFLLTTPHKNKKTGTINFFEKTVSELILPPINKNVKKRKLKTLLKRADVVIDFDTTLAPLHSLFADKNSIAYCHFGFDNIWKGQKRKMDKLAYRLGNYRHIVMLCEEMKQDAAKMYPELSSKLVKIYNALDIAAIQQKAADPVSLPEDFIRYGYIVSVGRLHEAQKDFTTLVKAYADAVKRHGIAERLIIVGEGGALEDLEKLAIGLNVRERIWFTGHQENPYKWMKQARLFLFSSKYEGLPTVLIEAHALNLPIVATNTPTGVKELVMNGNAGALVPIGDVEKMSDALATVLKDTAIQKLYQENGQKLLPQFSIEYMIPKLEELFA